MRFRNNHGHFFLDLEVFFIGVLDFQRVSMQATKIPELKEIIVSEVASFLMLFVNVIRNFVDRLEEYIKFV